MEFVVKNAILLGMAIAALASPCHAETISPRRILEVADLEGPVISPDGSKVAFRLDRASVERNTYDTIWYVQDMSGRAPPRRVAEGGMPLRDTAGVPLPASAVWSPDGRWIYYRALMDGRVDVWRAAADGSRAEPLTLDPADVRDFELSADGKNLVYGVGATREEIAAAEKAEYDQGIRIDETVPIGQNLFRSGYIDGRLATQRTGVAWFARDTLLADKPLRWKAIDLEMEAGQDPTAAHFSLRRAGVSDLPNALPEPWKVAFEPGNGRIALLTRIGEAEGLRDRPDVELAMLPRKEASQPIVCRAEMCTGKAISSIQWRPDSDDVLFTVTDPYEGLAQSIFRWNVRTGAVDPVAHSAGLITGGRDFYNTGACGVSPRTLACVSAEADRPPRLERIDLETGERLVLFDPNAALAMDMAATAPARLLRWTDANGQTFTGRFFAARRMGDVPSPLFVTYYRCTGFLRGNVGDEWPLATLAQSGISSLCINSAPYRPDAVERYGQGLSAVGSAIDLLASEGQIDRTRVGMGGLSFGAEVTYWTVMQSELLAAASVASTFQSPIAYLFRSLIGDPFFENRKNYWQLGALDETPERWRELSIVFNLEKITAPVLMQLPEQEYLITLDYAIPLIRSHRADLYVFPHEPHQKFQPRHKLAVYERNLDWFRFWLQDYEDPDPAKREQYEHWRLMRNAQASGPD